MVVNHGSLGIRKCIERFGNERLIRNTVVKRKIIGCEWSDEDSQDVGLYCTNCYN